MRLATITNYLLTKLKILGWIKVSACSATTILLAYTLFVAFTYGLNTESSLPNQKFFSKYPAIAHTYKELTNYYGPLVSLKLLEDSDLIAHDLKLVDVGFLKMCHIEINTDAPFFNSAAFPGLKMATKYEMVYAHELAHCIDKPSLADRLYESKHGFEDAIMIVGVNGISDELYSSPRSSLDTYSHLSKGERDFILKGEVFADVYSALYILKNSTSPDDYTQKLDAFKHFAAYRSRVKGSSHTTGPYLARVLNQVDFDSVHNMSLDDIHTQAQHIKGLVN